MLTGLERFVRIVVERETLVPRSQAPPEAKTRCIVISYKGGGGVMQPSRNQCANSI